MKKMYKILAKDIEISQIVKKKPTMKEKNV